MHPVKRGKQEVKEMKEYKASVVIRQKNDIDGMYRQVCFDFGDEILEARNFIQMADKALTRYNVYFEIVYEEIVTNEE